MASASFVPAPILSPAAAGAQALSSIDLRIAGSGSSTSASSLTAMQPIAGLDPAAGPMPAPFSDLLSEAVGQVEQLEKQARSAVEGLISGSGVDVHEAMIATEKSEMGFELMLSLRNKALSAYQQIMGMQF